MTKDEALDLALEALEKSDGFLYNWHENATDDEADAYATARQLNEKAITAIKKARSAPVQKRPQNCGTGYCSCIECVMELAPVQEPVAWTPIDQPYPPGGELDILMGDGSILCEVLPQSDGDLWWGGASTGERFIDPKYASVTHWRIHAEHTTPPARPAPVQEPVAEVKAKMTGGNVGIATVINEIYSPHREPLQPGDKLYAGHRWLGWDIEQVWSERIFGIDMRFENLQDAIKFRDKLDEATPPAAQRQWVGLTKTVVGNHLRRHALGDQPTFRQGFKEGVTFAELKLKESNI